MALLPNVPNFFPTVGQASNCFPSPYKLRFTFMSQIYECGNDHCDLSPPLCPPFPYHPQSWILLEAKQVHKKSINPKVLCICFEIPTFISHIYECENAHCHLLFPPLCPLFLATRNLGWRNPARSQKSAQEIHPIQRLSAQLSCQFPQMGRRQLSHPFMCTAGEGILHFQMYNIPLGFVW